MDFLWSSLQQGLYDQAYSFASNHIELMNGSILFNEELLKEQWKICAKFGLTGGCIEKEYNGKAWDPLTTAYIFESFAHAGVDRGLLFSIAAHLFPVLSQLQNMLLKKLKKQSYLNYVMEI